jgi:SdrD B-like domain/RTX calcium-binding nonapeptide repeat (4 copies)/Repeat of unknown function (DUF5648)
MSSVLKVTYPDILDEFGQPASESATGSGEKLKFTSIPDQKAIVVVNTTVPVVPADITTSSRDDQIAAGDNEFANDVVNSGAGNDSVKGRAGNDTLDGGDGNDSLDGGFGDDSLIGANGNDTIIGGAGNDSVNGGAGDDVLNISTGDSVTGGAGADRINFDLSTGFDPKNPPSITDFASGEDEIAILGQDGAKLSYDPTAKELLLDGQPLIQLDANVVLSEGDLVTSTGVEIPFEETAPVTYKLSGTVYNDTNAPDANAIEPADTPIAGVKVELFAADAAGKAVGAALGSDTTDAKGFYEFADLADGDYVVKETQPEGYTSVTDKDGGNPDEILAKITGANSGGNDFLEEKSSTDPGTDPDSPYDEAAAIHEFYNESENSFFYTIDENEKSYIQENLSNYEYRGGETLESTDKDAVAVDSLTGAEVESEEVYRFVNTVTGAHLYTTDEGERDYITENLEHYGQDESNFYAYETEVEGSVEVHRFYNAAEDIHMFTHSEADTAEMMAEDSGFNDEGVAFYAMSSDGMI